MVEGHGEPARDASWLLTGSGCGQSLGCQDPAFPRPLGWIRGFMKSAKCQLRWSSCKLTKVTREDGEPPVYVIALAEKEEWGMDQKGQ